MKEVEKNVILPNYHVLRDQQIMLIYNKYDDNDVILLQIIKIIKKNKLNLFNFHCKRPRLLSMIPAVCKCIEY